MPDRIFATPESQRAGLRQLKILVVILIVSNIGLGLFGVYVLRAIDQKYSALIGRSVPSLNELQTLTAGSMEAMRSTNPSRFEAAPGGAVAGIREARVSIERDRDLRGRALEREWLILRPNERKEFRDAGDLFTRGAFDVLSLIEAGRFSEANQQREKSLRPVFERYVESTSKTADTLEAESLHVSGALTARTGHLSQVMLGLGGWPVMIVGLFFLAVFVFVIGVLVRVTVFRGAEA